MLAARFTNFPRRRGSRGYAQMVCVRSGVSRRRSWPGRVMSIRREALVVAVGMLLACLAALLAPGLAGAVTLPPDFSQTTAISGLTRPTDVEIAPNGRVFVAERSGIVKTYSSIADTSATVAADLRTQVHNFSARGLMSLAVDPGLPDAALHLRLLQPRRQDRRHAAPLRSRRPDQRQLREGARRPGRELHRRGAHIAPADQRRGDDRPRAGAGRGLLPPVPGPHRRRARVRRRRLPVRVRLGRLDRQAVGLGPDRHARQPVR